MSKPVQRSFACSCGETFEADVFRTANVTLQPDLKRQILAGEFNHAACPACGRRVDAAVPFLYHDMAAELLVWVYPPTSEEQAEAIREKVRRSHEIVGTVLPVPTESSRRPVVFGVAELLPLLGDAPTT
jgi:hypothetical protein